MNKSKQGGKMRLGLIVFVVLMIVEIVEYIIGVQLKSSTLLLLVLLAIPGAGLIVYYYMHITQLWRSEE